MQRNMLLAFALMIAILWLWQKFFMPPPPKPEQPVEQVTEWAGEQPPDQITPGEQATTPSIPTTEPAIMTEEPAFVDDLSTASDVIIENAHLSATFTTHGGLLTSLRLPEYDAKLGGSVEIVPHNEEMHWPLGLDFKDPQYGRRDEDFIYEHAVYGPSDSVLSELADGLRECSDTIFPEADAAEISRQISACLPATETDADLRAAVVAVAAENVSTAKNAGGLSEQAELLETGSHLIFSRQLTSRIRLVKAFTFPSDTYSFNMHTVIQNTGGEPLILGRNRPNYSISWLPGMETSERALKGDQLLGMSLVSESYEQKALKKFKDGMTYPDTLEWIGLKRKFFFVLLEPRDGLLGASMKTNDVKLEKLQIDLDMPPVTLEPGGVAADTVRICAGPALIDVLASLGPGFDQVINFGFFDFFGKILMMGLLWFNKYVQNYGLAIILLTIVVRVGLFPLNQKSYKSMKEMQAVQPLVNELREKHKNNPQEMNKKMMALYREHKVNPLGGCLPMVFQMPIFIALFQALRNAVELRGAQFLWIADLSEPDRLFELTKPINLPINLLPLLVIIAMVVQQRMTPMAAGGQSEAQQKMMQYMPIFFGFIFYNMPAGLTVYFLVTTVLGLVQQYFVQKAT
jgi:YidC/Oxa1 family membrane protein insertase